MQTEKANEMNAERRGRGGVYEVQALTYFPPPWWSNNLVCIDR